MDENHVIPDAAEDGAAENTQERAEKSKQTAMSPEQRRYFAARRRNAELRAAIEEAVERERRGFLEYLGAQGASPGEGSSAVGGEAAHSPPKRAVPPAAEFEVSGDLKSTPGPGDGGQYAAPDEVTESREPEARHTAEENPETARAIGEAARERARAGLWRQYMELREFDPTVGTLAELAEGAAGRELAENYAATGDLLKAYKLTFFDRLSARSRHAAATGRAYSVASREHLRRTTPRADDAARLTEDMIDSYRALDPGITLEEIRAYEAKYRKTK